MLGIILGGMLIFGTAGILLTSCRGALFRNMTSFAVPAVILTVIFTLFFTFRTPLGKWIFSIIGDGNGGSLIIFGGPIPIPIAGAVFCFFPLILLGAATSIIVLCLLDLVASLFIKR